MSKYETIMSTPFLAQSRTDIPFDQRMRNAHKTRMGVCVKATHCTLCNEPIEVGDECCVAGTAPYCSPECRDEDFE